MNTLKKSPRKPSSHQVSDGKYRVALIDPHPCTRKGLAQCILESEEMEHAWECSSAEEAFDLIHQDQPDGLILEILLPGKDGVEFIKHLHPLFPDLKILVHSVHSEEFYAERCLRAGALGYLPKTGSLAQINKALHKVLHGDIFLNPRITRQTLHTIAGHNGRNHDDHHLHNLTDRELEIMILMAHGLTAHESAEKLCISPRTVQVHRNNIRLKIGLESALQLHAYAVRFYSDEAELHHDN